MNHRPSTILPWISLLAVLMLASLSQAQGLMLDKCLDDLAEKGSLGPVVAVMHGPVEGTADLTSLEGLAKTFGLKLFEQDGIHVLGPEECLYLYDLSEYFPPRPKPMVLPEDRLLRSMTSEQLRMLGSPSGLGYADLSEEQQSYVKTIFTGDTLLEVPTGERPTDKIETPSYYPIEVPSMSTPALPRPFTKETKYTKEVNVSSLPIEQVTITGSLVYEPVLVGDHHAENPPCTLDTKEDTSADTSEYNVQTVETEATTPIPPKPFGPNVLKPSQLDYERPELQKQVHFESRTNLRDAIAVAAKESGLPLLVGPGSEQVPLDIKASAQSIGQMLKAVSLATGGTWRRIGDVFLFTLDTMGLGRFLRQVVDYENTEYAGRDIIEQPFDSLKVREVMLNLPAAQRNTFSLTTQQTVDLTERLAQGLYDDADSIPWSALTSEQQNVVLQECEDLDMKKAGGISLTPFASAELAFHFPSVGNANIGYVPARYVWEVLLLPPHELCMSAEFQARAWPKGAKIPMPSGVRGLLYKVGKSDTPAAVVTATQRYGFNTLLLRIFADGYTIFPSIEFPQLSGLKADDFLRNVIAIAHSRGIKVVGVIDVLRWSDGDKKHWLYKNLEIIDRDIAGSMNTEWMANRALGPTIEIEERLRYGDAFDGDFVSPFHPLVRQKLSGLVGELASYDLDCLAFDHTAIRYMPLWDESDSPRQTGFNDLARSAFVRLTGVDPTDITDPDTSEYLLPTPLVSVAAGASSQQKTWAAFYRTACDALLDILVEDCRKAKPGVPIWVVDTYRHSTADTVKSHDWSEFKGRIDRVIGMDAGTEPDYPGEGIETTQLVRITDAEDLLYMASYIANLQNKTFPGMLLEEDLLSSPPETPIKDIILDFPCSEKRKTEFLKLLETARPVKTR